MTIAWLVFCAFVVALIFVARIKDLCSEWNFYALMVLTILAALSPIYWQS